MSRKRNPTLEELEAEEREIARREAAAAEARMDAPVSRRELCEALEKVGRGLWAAGLPERDALGDTLIALAKEMA